MTGHGGNRVGLRVLTVTGTLSAGLAGGLLAPAGASASTGGAALVQAYLSARHLPAGSVAGIRAGSSHTASAAGATWAIADFTPSASAGPQVQAEFQDGAGTGIFRQVRGQPWQLVPTGPCGRGLPAGLGQERPAPGICGTAIATQRSAAVTARTRAGTVRTLGQSIADIALGQVGAGDTPAETSFAGLDCDPYSTLVGAPSPDANGCGLGPDLKIEDQNEAWCSDFAKWVWQQAGVTTGMSTINAESGSFYDWGLAQGEAMPADGGTPAPGDAVVFFPPGPIGHPAYGDHVGIVTAVNPGGTVNLVNGDFLGASNISVQYDTTVSLTSWAAQRWGPGEQWALIAPPAGPQQPAPSVTVSAPQVAVAGTATSFGASGTAAGSITQYQWTFGDGRTQSGPNVSTVFPGPGIYPVTMTATASTGTVITHAWDVDVAGASSAVTSIPGDAVSQPTARVEQDLFLPTATGGLAAESSDGQGWRRQALPGQPGAAGTLTALAYPDPAAGDAVTPHAYFRSTGGTLAATYPAGAAWTTKTLPGRPEPGTALVGTTAGSVPAVFYFGTGGQLSETVEQGTTWVTSTLPGPRSHDAASLTLADTAGATAGVRLFSLGAPGKLSVTSDLGHGWQSGSISSPYGIAADSPLSAVSAGAGQAGVFFVDGRGKLAEANQAGQGWAVHELSGTTATTALAAGSHPLGSGVPAAEVFWLTRDGQPALTAWTGRQWQTTMLPGTATSIPAVSVYPGQPTELFLADGTRLGLDRGTGTGPGTGTGAWTATTLPGSAATLADRVLLYAATPGDLASARGAAS